MNSHFTFPISVPAALASLCILALATIMPATAAAQVERFVADTHYTVLRNPVATADPSKIEVIDVFWYGCAHCFRMEPLIDHWVANKPADVNFVRVPAIWNSLMKTHAQLFYTAQALDVLDAMHSATFDAINVERNRLQNEEKIADLFAAHGVAEEDFTRAFNSFSVRTKVNQAESRMEDYEIASTPNLVVNGKYLVAGNQQVTSQQEMLEIVDFLVAKERQLKRSSAE